MRLIFFLCVAVVFAVSCKMESQDEFSRIVLQKRHEKDSFFKFNNLSPIPPAEKRWFFELKYYKPKEDYIVKGTLKLLPQPQPVLLVTNYREKVDYLKMGTVQFELQGHPLELVLYQQEKNLTDSNRNTLFLPFLDKTNGKETNELGRALDVHYTGSDTVTLDFNYAYNPWSAYNRGYSAPVPPPVNTIPIKVEAGEKTWFTAD